MNSDEIVDTLAKFLSSCGRNEGGTIFSQERNFSSLTWMTPPKWTSRGFWPVSVKKGTGFSETEMGVVMWLNCRRVYPLSSHLCLMTLLGAGSMPAWRQTCWLSSENKKNMGNPRCSIAPTPWSIWGGGVGIGTAKVVLMVKNPFPLSKVSHAVNLWSVWPSFTQIHVTWRAFVSHALSHFYWKHGIEILIPNWQLCCWRPSCTRSVWTLNRVPFSLCSTRSSVACPFHFHRRLVTKHFLFPLGNPKSLRKCKLSQYFLFQKPCHF